jgi:hemerythrin superfamily protein
MDAIKLIKSQHREVESLFKEFARSGSESKKRVLFDQIADDLAIHSSIEERFFYPMLRKRQTEEAVEEAYDEHLEIKKLMVDAMRSAGEPGFDSKVAALKGAVLYHVEEEESELLPSAKKLLGKDMLEALGERMEIEVEQMKSAGNARLEVTVESEPPAVHP